MSKEFAKEISELLPNLIRHMYPFVFQPLALPPSQVLTLSTLNEKGSLSVGQLSKEMHNSAPTMSGIINRLERSGYVKRKMDDSDRRIITVILTTKGSSIVKQFQENIMHRWLFILSRMSEKEGENVLGVLKRITKGFENETPQ